MRSVDSRGGCRYEELLVAAGVGLRRNEHQARANRLGLRLRSRTETIQDAENRGICGENAEPY